MVRLLGIIRDERKRIIGRARSQKEFGFVFFLEDLIPGL